MPRPPTLDEVEAPLRAARCAAVMRLTSRAMVLIGLALLAISLVAIATLWRIEARLLPALAPLFATVLALTGAAGVTALAVAWRRQRQLEGTAARGQRVFPILGLRLSASLEVPQLRYCPASIRQALWRDTLVQLARVPWRKFVGWFSASVWLVLALLVLLIEIALVLPAGRDLLLPAPVARAIAPVKPFPPFKAALEIPEPAKDQWATKIEAIPLQVRGESPLGFEKLRLSVSVNGQPSKDLPLDADRLPKGTGATTGSLYLDELELQDYDVVSYSVAGEAAKPGGGSAEIVSPIYFVQIRPFRKDVLESESAGRARMRELINLLYWLIEEERRIARGTWLVKSDAALNRTSAAYDEAARTILESQRTALKTTIEAYAHFGAKEEDAIPAEILAQLDKARESMEAAVPPLEHRDWKSALPPEQQALSRLVEILRNIQEVIMKSKGGTPDAQKERKTLEDRQTHRNESELEQLARQQERLNQDMRPPSEAKQAAKERIEQLARQQEQLNQDMAQAARSAPSPATGAPKDNPAMGQRQRELAKQTSQVAGETSLAENIRQNLNEAQQAMQEATRALEKNQTAEAQKDGQQAAALLAKAAQQQEQAANQTTPSASASVSSQALAGREQELMDKASEAAGKTDLNPATRQTLNEAQRAMQQTANALAKDQRDQAQTAGQKAKELLDQATAQEMGRRMQEAARELETMLQKMGEHQGELRKEGGRQPEKQAAAGRDLEAMSKDLQELAQQTGKHSQTSFEEAAAKTGEAGKQLSDGKGAPETLDPPMQAVARALQETRGRAAQLARLEEELRQMEQQMRGVIKRMEGKPPKTGQPDQPGDRSGLSPAAKECLQELQERNGPLTAELQVALGTSTGMSHWNTVSQIPYRGDGNPVVIKNIKDWLQATQMVHRELEAQLRNLNLSDELSAMLNEDSPPEYRDLVSAYFERLSREFQKKSPPTQP